MKKFIGMLMLFFLSFLWGASPPTAKASMPNEEMNVFTSDVSQVTVTTCTQDAMILTATDPDFTYVLDIAGFMEQPSQCVYNMANVTRGMIRHYKPFSPIGSGGPLNWKYLLTNKASSTIKAPTNDPDPEANKLGHGSI